MKNETKSSLAMGFASLIFFISLLLIIWSVAKHLSAGASIEQLSFFGTWIGGITAPMLGMAGYLVIYATFMDQQKAFLESQRENQLQLFEQTAYRMMEFRVAAINQIQEDFRTREHADFFKAVMGTFTDAHNGDFEYANTYKCYERVYKNNRHAINHYFKSTCLLLEFVANFKPKGMEEDAAVKRKKFTRLLGMQLWDYELRLLFYHALCHPDSVDGLTKNMLVEHLFRPAVGVADFLVDETHYDHLNRLAT